MLGGDTDAMLLYSTSRQLRHLACAALLLSAVLGTSTGCGEEFDPAWRVQGYRLLAIQASPPVLQEGETATLRAIDYIPDDRNVTYTWEWCPFETSAQNQFKCPEFEPSDLTGATESALRTTRSALHLDAGDAHADTGPRDTRAMDATVADTTPPPDAAGDASTSDAGDGPPTNPFPPSGEDPFSLGTGREIQFPYPGSEQQILAVCQAIQRAVARAGQDSPLSGRLPTADCSRGYAISIRVVIDTGDDKIVASKKLELSTGSDQINQNPAIAGIDIRPAKASDISRLRQSLDWVVSSDRPRSEQWVAMPDDQPIPLAPDTSFDLRADVDRDDIESWRPPAPEGSDREELPPRLEIWQFKWYTTLGDLAESDRLYDPDLNTLEQVTRSGVTIHTDQLDGCPTSDASEACLGHLWHIIRDGRLGLDWAERTFSIQRPSQ